MRSTIDIVAAVAAGAFFYTVDGALVPRAADGLARKPMMGYVSSQVDLSKLYKHTNLSLVAGIHTTFIVAPLQKPSFSLTLRESFLLDYTVLDMNMLQRIADGQLKNVQVMDRLPGTQKFSLQDFLHLESFYMTGG